MASLKRGKLFEMCQDIESQMLRVWSKVRDEEMSWEQAKQVTNTLIWKHCSQVPTESPPANPSPVGDLFEYFSPLFSSPDSSITNQLQVLLCYESQGLLCKVNNKNVWQFLRFWILPYLSYLFLPECLVPWWQSWREGGCNAISATKKNKKSYKWQH